MSAKTANDGPSGSASGALFKTYTMTRTELSLIATKAALADYPDFVATVRIRALIREYRPAYVAGLALELRHRYLGKTVPFLLTAELARWRGGLIGLDAVLDEVIEHVGEVPDWLAQFEASAGSFWGRRGPVFLRRILGMVFDRLDAVHLSQCSPEEQVRLRQALLYIRPKATDKEQEALLENVRRNYWAPYRQRPALRAAANLIETDFEQ